jgi:hypothetical protein
MEKVSLIFGSYVLLVTSVAQAQFGYSTNANGSVYAYNTNGDGSANIVAFFQGTPCDVAIPTNINNQTVTSIGDFAFTGTGVTSVTMPSVILTIGHFAFGLCPNLTSAVIPGSITNIGSQAFTACANLKPLTVDPTNSFYSSVNGVLFDKAQATLIQYPGGLSGNYVIPSSVTIVQSNSFLGSSNIATVSIPGSVTNIGDYALLATSLIAITVDPENSFFSSRKR